MKSKFFITLLSITMIFATVSCCSATSALAVNGQSSTGTNDDIFSQLSGLFNSSSFLNELEQFLNTQNNNNNDTTPIQPEESQTIPNTNSTESSGQIQPVQNNTNFNSESSTQALPSTGSSTTTTLQEDLDAADEALSKLQEIFYAEDWKWYSDGDGYINGKWDEGVMYDPVPSPPEGISVVEMQFTSKQSKKYYNYGSIGEMYIDGTDYEYIWVNFNCSKVQLDELVNSFVDNGWFMEFNQSYGNGDMWHFYLKDYYAYLRAGSFMADSGFEIGAYLNVVPAYYKLPEVFAEVPLPQIGIMLDSPYTEYYNKDYEYLDIEETLYVPIDQMPEKWTFLNEYYGVTSNEIMAYKDCLVNYGYELISEYKNKETDWDPKGYDAYLQKGDIKINISGQYDYIFTIRIYNDENLFY